MASVIQAPPTAPAPPDDPGPAGRPGLAKAADRLRAPLGASALAAVVTALAVGGLRWATGSPQDEAALVAVAVLACAAPLLVVLARPWATRAARAKASALGVELRGPDAVRVAGSLDALVVVGTGSLTAGRAVLTDVHTAGRLPKVQALRAAAAVEAGSPHRVARAIVTAAAARGLDLPDVTDRTTLPGQGVSADIRGTRVAVGRSDLFEDVPPELTRPTVDGTTVWLGWEGTARATFTVSTPVARGTARAVTELAAAGVPVHLLTGDTDDAALTVARDAAIAVGRVLADVAPDRRPGHVERLRSRDRVVGVVGVGREDLPVLRAADLAVVMRTDDVPGQPDTSADLSAGLVDHPAVMRAAGGLGGVATGLALARAGHRTAVRQRWWAVGHAALLGPLTAVGVVQPTLAVAASAVSLLGVAASTHRVGRTTT